MSHIDADVAEYMAAVAKALEAVPACKATYGEFYVSEAVISFDGQLAGYAVVANEHGGYSLDFAHTNAPDEPAREPESDGRQGGAA